VALSKEDALIKAMLAAASSESRAEKERVNGIGATSNDQGVAP